MWCIPHLIDGVVWRTIFFSISISLRTRYNRRNSYRVNTSVFIYFNLLFLPPQKPVNFSLWNLWKITFSLGLKKETIKQSSNKLGNIDVLCNGRLLVNQSNVLIHIAVFIKLQGPLNSFEKWICVKTQNELLRNNILQWYCTSFTFKTDVCINWNEHAFGWVPTTYKVSDRKSIKSSIPVI